MLVIFQTEIYHDGNVRLQLMREDIPLSPRLRASYGQHGQGIYGCF
jgi:hypothetical protein